MTAYIYVRKSVVRDDTSTHSPAVQEERLRALAAAHGDADPVVIADLDISGKEVERRPGYMALVDAIDTGEAHAVYAYDLSRLHRNVAESARFWRLVADRGTPVYLTDQTVDPSTATGRLTIGLFAQMNEWQREVTSEKLRATFARKRANGERLGGRPYGDRPGEDLAAVVDAFRASGGSYVAAARTLNAAGVPTRNGRSRGWQAQAVKVIVARVAPDLIADLIRMSPKGKATRGKQSHLLARLLRCGVCGSMLSTSTDRVAGRTYVRAYCHLYDNQSPQRHAHRGVQYATILPAIRDEAARYATAYLERQRAMIDRNAPTATMAELDERRRLAGKMLRDRSMTEAEYDHEIADIDATEATLARVTDTKVAFPPTIGDTPDDDDPRWIIPSDSPEEVNAYLRRIFDHIDVDLGTRRGYGVAPALTFVWRDPTLRADYGDSPIRVTAAD